MDEHHSCLSCILNSLPGVAASTSLWTRSSLQARLCLPHFDPHCLAPIVAHRKFCCSDEHSLFWTCRLEPSPDCVMCWGCCKRNRTNACSNSPKRGQETLVQSIQPQVCGLPQSTFGHGSCLVPLGQGRDVRVWTSCIHLDNQLGERSGGILVRRLHTPKKPNHYHYSFLYACGLSDFIPLDSAWWLHQGQEFGENYLSRQYTSHPFSHLHSLVWWMRWSER